MKTFNDPLNTAVFTTRFVIIEKKLITYISHDEDDGAWQFLSNDSVDNLEDYAMIVGLGEIIKLDNSVLDMADLPLGFFATRESEKDNWTIQKQ